MTETIAKTLNHYALFRFTSDFWQLPAQERGTFFSGLQADLHDAATCLHFYQVSPLRADADFLLWSALPVNEDADTAHFFYSMARSINARRKWVELTFSLWGYTKPSQYSRGKSPQEIEPLEAERKPYLVVYPFVKTVEWYLLSRDTRQGMMNQHIRTGHQYPEIKQLLLYSFGVQDQEFVVVYEMDSLNQFSDLVNELRGSEVRRYTERDTPNITALYHSPEALGSLYAQG